jgi:hypothetical protein
VAAAPARVIAFAVVALFTNVVLLHSLIAAGRASWLLRLAVRVARLRGALVAIRAGAWWARRPACWRRRRCSSCCPRGPAGWRTSRAGGAAGRGAGATVPMVGAVTAARKHDPVGGGRRAGLRHDAGWPGPFARAAPLRMLGTGSGVSAERIRCRPAQPPAPRAGIHSRASRRSRARGGAHGDAPPFQAPLTREAAPR